MRCNAGLSVTQVQPRDCTPTWLALDSYSGLDHVPARGASVPLSAWTRATVPWWWTSTSRWHWVTAVICIECSHFFAPDNWSSRLSCCRCSSEEQPSTADDVITVADNLWIWLALTFIWFLCFIVTLYVYVCPGYTVGHHALNDIIYGTFSSAATKKPVCPTRLDGKRSDGLTLVPRCAGEPLTSDVTSHFLAVSILAVSL